MTSPEDRVHEGEAGIIREIPVPCRYEQAAVTVQGARRHSLLPKECLVRGDVPWHVGIVADSVALHPPLLMVRVPAVEDALGTGPGDHPAALCPGQASARLDAVGVPALARVC